MRRINIKRYLDKCRVWGYAKGRNKVMRRINIKRYSYRSLTDIAPRMPQVQQCIEECG